MLPIASSRIELSDMKASIIGIGSTKFKEHWDQGIKDMIHEACVNATKSANIKLKDIDSLFVANCFSNMINGQSNINALCSDILGIQNSTTISGGDNAGAHAILQAANAIAAESSKIALVIGIEKMSDLSVNETTEVSSQLIDYENESSHGATLASQYAMITQRHMKEHGTTQNQLDAVSVKNHANAAQNEIAQFRFNVTSDDISKSPMVASPIRVLHSAAASDGCCAVIMCNGEVSKKYKNKIDLIGHGIGSDFLAIHEREDITSFNSVKEASQKAFKRAGIKASDIGFVEIHDVFSIAEIISLEDVGFAKKGEAGKFIESGKASINGKLPVNPSGGLKGCGHPFAASGIRQAMEVFLQLNNIAGKRQVDDARYALTQSLSGTGSNAVVSIFSK